MPLCNLFLFPCSRMRVAASWGQPLGISPGILARCDLRLVSVSDQLCQLSVFPGAFSSLSSSRNPLSVQPPRCWSKVRSWSPPKRPALCWLDQHRRRAEALLELHRATRCSPTPSSGLLPSACPTCHPTSNNLRDSASTNSCHAVTAGSLFGARLCHATLGSLLKSGERLLRPRA